MRILETGSRGMLGTAIKQVFQNHDLIETKSNELDIRNPKQVMSFTGSNLDLILHLAAETDLSKAQFNPGDAYLTNHTGTQNMVELASELDVPIVYISTAMVFDGNQACYREGDLPNPTNHYGRSKYYGEIAVKAFEKHYIIRNGWGFGGGPDVDKKFVNKIYQQIQAGKKRLFGITDLIGSPTYTVDFAQTLRNVVEAEVPYGTYHSTGKGPASRFDVLKTFVDFLDLSNVLEIVPVTLDEYVELFPLPFPYIKSEVLSIEKLEKTGLSAMRDWQTALFEYSKKF